MESRDIFIIRGPSGSGKSTVAKEYFGKFPNVEADDYFYHDGEYKFNPTLLKEAHDAAKERVISLLKDNKAVVISNTFTRLWEIESYINEIKLKTDYNIVLSVYRTDGEWENIHKVPEEVVALQRGRMEPYPNEIMLHNALRPIPETLKTNLEKTDSLIPIDPEQLEVGDYIYTFNTGKCFIFNGVAKYSLSCDVEFMTMYNVYPTEDQPAHTLWCLESSIVFKQFGMLP